MGEPRQIYQTQILDHYKHPRNKGTLDDATCRATERNTLCGDQISLYLRIGADGCVEEARFDGQGCAISVASASILTTMLQGRTLREAAALDEAALLSTVGVSPSSGRKECALLSLLALRSALRASPEAG